MFTWHNTWNEIEAAQVRTAVVPIGSTEQHGTHLPLRTDTLVTDWMARFVAEHLHAYLTPTIPIGQSSDWLDFPGTLSLSTETMQGVITDIVSSLVVTGFTTILFISFHGANLEVYQGFPESLQARYPGVRIFTAGFPFWARETWAAIWREALERTGIADIQHSDEAETSLILALRPELVGDHPTDCPIPDDPWPPISKRQVYPSGSIGYPSKATREKGERMLAELQRLILADLDRQMSAS